jgi:hypothetical protein
LEDGTLVHGNSKFKVVLVGVANEGFFDEVEVVALAIGVYLGKQLEGLLRLHGVKVLACEDVIDSRLFVTRDSQMLSADLCQRVDVLAIDFEELSHPILGVVDSHGAVDDNLVPHVLALDGEGHCGLVGHLVVAESVLLGVIGKL